jgi:hypothetical protein
MPPAAATPFTFALLPFTFLGTEEPLAKFGFQKVKSPKLKVWPNDFKISEL